VGVKKGEKRKKRHEDSLPSSSSSFIPAMNLGRALRPSVCPPSEKEKEEKEERDPAASALTACRSKYRIALEAFEKKEEAPTRPHPRNFDPRRLPQYVEGVLIRKKEKKRKKRGRGLRPFAH